VHCEHSDRFYWHSPDWSEFFEYVIHFTFLSIVFSSTQRHTGMTVLQQGIKRFGDAICFHYVSPEWEYLLDFIYHTNL